LSICLITVLGRAKVHMKKVGRRCHISRSVVLPLPRHQSCCVVIHGAAVFIGHVMYRGAAKDVSFRKSFQRMLDLKIV
jgi:hypothetical protein